MGIWLEIHQLWGNFNHRGGGGNHDGISRKTTLDTACNRASHQHLGGLLVDQPLRSWKQVNLSQEAEYMRKFADDLRKRKFRKRKNVLVPETLELAGLFWERLVQHGVVGGVVRLSENQKKPTLQQGAQPFIVCIYI